MAVEKEESLSTKKLGGAVVEGFSGEKQAIAVSGTATGSYIPATVYQRFVTERVFIDNPPPDFPADVAEKSFMTPDSGVNTSSYVLIPTTVLLRSTHLCVSLKVAKHRIPHYSLSYFSLL